VARLDPLPLEQLTPEQKALYDVLFSKRKRVTGPFTVWLHNPALADAANRLVQALRHDAKLDKRLYELIVLIVVRDRSAQYAWAVHEAPALESGLSRDTVEAIRERRPPNFDREDERIVYEATTELMAGGPLSAEKYRRLIGHFGLDLTIEIVSVAGLYAMVSAVLNGFDIPTPNGERPFG
jgi:4-carboxymuconolactone decarboxylase